MNDLAIAQARYDAALPPDHDEPDEDPVDVMLATPEFAMQPHVIDKAIEHFEDVTWRYLSVWLSAFMDHKDEGVRALLAVKAMKVLESASLAALRKLAEKKVAENRRVALEEV